MQKNIRNLIQNNEIYRFFFLLKKQYLFLFFFVVYSLLYHKSTVKYYEKQQIMPRTYRKHKIAIARILMMNQCIQKNKKKH